MENVVFEHLPHVPVHRQKAEFVERKGLGHPDTICDAVMEAVSLDLCREYERSAGRVLHHNIDKGLLVAGQSSPACGGGTVDAPMRLIVGDRATAEWEGGRIDVDGVAEAAARRWFAENLRFVEPDRHLVLQNELRPGSAELLDIFAREVMTANDTSAAVGFAPLTETERLVLAAERRLNSREFKDRFPAAGEDVKVLGIRRDRRLELTVALAFVDRFVQSASEYFQQKEAIAADLRGFLQSRLDELDGVELQINTLDDPDRGAGGMYLTVLGTSAESGDGGQVGRGNRVNGLISLNRPMSTEAAAGKNPVSHVGKIYNLLAHEIAGELYEAVEAIEEVSVWICSRIGRPLNEPWLVSTQVILAPGASLDEVRPAMEPILRSRLSAVDAFTERLKRGELAIH